MRWDVSKIRRTLPSATATSADSTKGSVLDGSWQLDEPQAPDHGYRTGRIKLGTESSGGFRNIVLTNCIFRTLSGTGARNRRRRPSGRHRYQQYHHEEYRQRSYLPSPGCAYTQSGRDTHRHHEAYSDQRHQCMERRQPVFFHYQRRARCIYRRCYFPATFIYIIKVDTAKKTASALHPNRRKYIPNPGCSERFPPKDFISVTQKNITFDGVRFHFAQPDGRPLFVTDDAENIEYYHTPQE